jgi:hypothetical protein
MPQIAAFTIGVRETSKLGAIGFIWLFPIALLT